MIYTASNGDTLDSVSYKIFGDEFIYPDIMQSNRGYADIVMFEGGERLVIPDNIIIDNVVIQPLSKTTTRINVIQPPWG